MVRTLADAGLDDSDRKLLHDVEDVGWHVVLIPPEEGKPGWAFSIGLFHSFGHPEVVVFGLPLELLGAVVNGVGEEVQAGKRFEAGQEHPDILEGVRCAFRPVDEGWYRPFLGYARWFYQGSEFPALQCLWPDKKQRFPWEPEFNEGWRWAQPLLHESEPVAARAVELLRSTGDWLFADPPNAITFTTRQVVREHQPILLVAHDDDEAWQFLHGGPVELADAMIVCLGHVVKLDPSLAELADLPVGWRASRGAPGEPWQRAPGGDDPD